MVCRRVVHRMMTKDVDLGVAASALDPPRSILPIPRSWADIESRRMPHRRRLPSLACGRLFHFKTRAEFVFKIPSGPVGGTMMPVWSEGISCDHLSNYGPQIVLYDRRSKRQFRRRSSNCRGRGSLFHSHWSSMAFEHAAAGHAQMRAILNKSSGGPCIRDDLMPDRLLPRLPPAPTASCPTVSCSTASCQGDRCASLSGLSAIVRPITPLRQRGNGTLLIILCWYASVRPHEG